MKYGRNNPDYHVDVFIGAGFDIWLHCYFLSGLIGLERAGWISLSCMSSREGRELEAFQRNGYPLFTIRCTCCKSGRVKRICFDARDQSNVWQKAALENVDIYFKRSLFPADADQLDPQYRSKVLPINPMFATWVSHAWKWKQRVFSFLASSGVQRLAAGNAVKNGLRDFMTASRNLATLSTLDQYEDSPESTKRPLVLFQTRLWDPAHEQGDWVEPCNEERVAMVQTLRRTLGDRFVGGLSYTPYACEHHPELLSNLTSNSKCKRPEFIALCRRFLVRVNIRALFDAIPYSLGESLAANNVIVSQPIRNHCEIPIRAGLHYLAFETPQECASICSDLLNSPAQVDALRKHAYEYYREGVHPTQAMKRYLIQAMQPGETE